MAKVWESFSKDMDIIPELCKQGDGCGEIVISGNC